jgi:hypothetical protein
MFGTPTERENHVVAQENHAVSACHAALSIKAKIAGMGLSARLVCTLAKSVPARRRVSRAASDWGNCPPRGAATATTERQDVFITIPGYEIDCPFSASAATTALRP